MPYTMEWMHKDIHSILYVSAKKMHVFSKENACFSKENACFSKE